MTFSEGEVEAVVGLEDHTALVLRSGKEIAVALSYDELEQKFYRPDFRTDEDGVLDLRAVTGAAVKAAAAEIPTGPGGRKPGALMPDLTIYAGQSPETGTSMFVQHPQPGVTLNFNDAARLAKFQYAGDNKDWRLPTQKELGVLFSNRAAIGGFHDSADGTAWYWAAEERGEKAAQQSFNNGHTGFFKKTELASVRYVRG